MTWQLAAAMNAVIAVGYFAICGTILRGLITTRQLRTNPLAIATAAIFFTCAVHHGAHTFHMLLPSFGIDRANGISLREAFGWQVVVWDTIGAGVAVYYLSLRRSYGTLLRTPAMFEDEVRRRTNERVEREREMLTQAEQLAGAGSWERDVSTGALTWSEGMCQIHGRTPLPVSRGLEHVLADVHPDDHDRVARELDPERPGPDHRRSAYRILRPDGGTRHLDTRARVERDRDGTAVRVVGASVDITERREIEAAREQAEHDLREREQMLSEAEERFRGAFENAPIGMALIGLHGRLLQANAELCQITGYDRVELEQLDLEALSYHEDARATAEALVRMTLRQHERHSAEQRIVRADRSTVWVQLQVTLLRDRDDQPVRFIAQIQDISARRKFEQQLRHMADHDPLTGLLNRRSFERALEQQLAHARRYKTGGALLFIDLDDFKYVNDSLGHAAGDKLITLVAGALTAELRETDVLARLGGDEFAVLLPHADAATAGLVADKLLRRVAELEVSMNGHGSARLTASSGIAMLDEDFPTADDALVAADLAMYDAKEAGKNRSLSYRTDEHYEPRIRARMTWIDRIKRALADDGAGFVLHAQPILDIQRGEVVRHELLVRMLVDGGELVMPATFLYIAERFDLIQELDRLVITRAAQALGNGTPGPIARVAVNVSGKSLADPGLPDFIERTLRDAGADPRRMCLEITETAAVSNIPLAKAFGERVGEIGCELALDDFGSGFGGFYYLKHLPFDYLKIDGEFITDCVNSRTDQLVIDSVVSLTHGLGKRTVAEFVADAETLQYLQDHGVDLAQGYHIGRPEPLADLSPRQPLAGGGAVIA